MNVLRGLCLVGALGVAICSCGGGDKGAPAAQDSSDGTAASVTRDLDAGASDPEVAYAITMKIQSFTVPANSEAWKCQDFASPFDNKQVDVIGWDFEMTPGSHHMTLFNTPNATNGPLVDCLNGPGGDTSYAFGAQAAKAAFKFPDGVGELIPSGLGFTINSHYVNATSASIQAVVSIKILVAKPGVVTQHSGGFEGVLYSISVPPTNGKPVTVGSSCTIPQDMNLLAISGHMHDRGSHFVATSGGKMLLQTDEVGAAPTLFAPAMQLKAGTDITWSCVYENETDQPLIYGPSAMNNVMCNTVLAFYPIQDESAALLSCFH